MIFKAVALAFGMFSAIPMPRVDWSEKNLRYMLCAFPLVGAVIGGLELGLCAAVLWGAERLAFLPRFLPLALVLIPVAVTGGIHLDGFMDTCDALASHADREKKLAILRDSHAGAFAVLGCVLYFLSQFVLIQELCRLLFEHIDEKAFVFRAGVCFASTFVLSRFLSAFSVATFPIAKDSGLVRTFADASAKKCTAWWCALWFLAISAVLMFFFGSCGCVVMVVSLLVFGGYFWLAWRQFGGITGDTAGAFVQLAELLSLAALVVTMEMV